MMADAQPEPQSEGGLRAHRRNMVRDQIEARGIRDSRILAAFEKVPREEFVSEAYSDSAYSDRALPIECGQTISQPYTVAFMCEAARINPTDRVLEIGTGSGYGAAILSNLSACVHTVERISVLAESAQSRLQRLSIKNVHVHAAVNSLGLVEQGPFDVIVVTAGAKEMPLALTKQLADGGRMIVPIGNYASQIMYCLTRSGDQIEQKPLGHFAFVPLIGEHGWRKR